MQASYVFTFFVQIELKLGDICYTRTCSCKDGVGMTIWPLYRLMCADKLTSTCEMLHIVSCDPGGYEIKIFYI